MAVVRVAVLLGGSFPCGSFPRWLLSGWQLSGGSCPGGACPGGCSPRTNVAVAFMSTDL